MFKDDLYYTELDEDLVFEWVKTGHWNRKDFLHWLELTRSDYYDRGMDKGYQDAVSNLC